MTLKTPTPADFSFLQAVEAHGWRRLVPFAWVDETGSLERIECFADGTVAKLTINEGEHDLRVDGQFAGYESEAVEVVQRMFQLDVDIAPFHAFCQNHPKLGDVPIKRQGRILVSPTLWEDVVKVIATTNTTWSQTKGMVARIVEGFGSPCPGTEARAFPSPEQIANISLDEFAAIAKMGYRNAAVHSLAVDIVEGRTNLEAFRALPGAELRKALLGLRGVGPYAASCLMIYLGHYDQVNVDSWARMMVGKELGRAVSDKEVHEFFAEFGEWAALAYHFYPWRGEEPAY